MFGVRRSESHMIRRIHDDILSYLKLRPREVIRSSNLKWKRVTSRYGTSSWLIKWVKLGFLLNGYILWRKGRIGSWEFMLREVLCYKIVSIQWQSDQPLACWIPKSPVFGNSVKASDPFLLCTNISGSCVLYSLLPLHRILSLLLGVSTIVRLKRAWSLSDNVGEVGKVDPSADDRSGVLQPLEYLIRRGPCTFRIPRKDIPLRTMSPFLSFTYLVIVCCIQFVKR
jgi:hypothetical protein